MNDWHEDGQAAHQLDLERQQEAMESLMQCQRAGAKPIYLLSLATQTWPA